MSSLPTNFWDLKDTFIDTSLAVANPCWGATGGSGAVPAARGCPAPIPAQRRAGCRVRAAELHDQLQPVAERQFTALSASSDAAWPAIHVRPRLAVAGPPLRARYDATRDADDSSLQIRSSQVPTRRPQQVHVRSSDRREHQDRRRSDCARPDVRGRLLSTTPSFASTFPTAYPGTMLVSMTVPTVGPVDR